MRQRPIDHYIVDFYCARAKLVVELDGGGHYSPEAERADATRTAALNRLGLEVIRFSNLDIDKRFEGVCTAIDIAVKRRSQSLRGNSPSHG